MERMRPGKVKTFCIIGSKLMQNLIVRVLLRHFRLPKFKFSSHHQRQFLMIDLFLGNASYFGYLIGAHHASWDFPHFHCQNSIYVWQEFSYLGNSTKYLALRFFPKLSLCFPLKQNKYLNKLYLRTVPTIVIAHMVCASPDTRISYRQMLTNTGIFLRRLKLSRESRS